MITLEILQPFCSTDGRRDYLHNPFTRAGFTWATNGAVIVRVPEVPGAVAGVKLNAEAVFSQYPPVEGHEPPPVPEAPEPKECDKCFGGGRQACPHCDHESDCDRCDGSGVIDYDPRWQRVDGAPFSCQLLRKVVALPGVRVGVGNHSHEAPSPRRYLYFTFDGGGAGVLLALDGAGGVEDRRPQDEWIPS